MTLAKQTHDLQQYLQHSLAYGEDPAAEQGYAHCYQLVI